MMGKAPGAEGARGGSRGLAGTPPHSAQVTEGHREAAEALAHGRRVHRRVRPRRPAVPGSSQDTQTYLATPRLHSSVHTQQHKTRVHTRTRTFPAVLITAQTPGGEAIHKGPRRVDSISPKRPETSRDFSDRDVAAGG